MNEIITQSKLIEAIQSCKDTAANFATKPYASDCGFDIPNIDEIILSDYARSNGLKIEYDKTMKYYKVSIYENSPMVFIRLKSVKIV